MSTCHSGSPLPFSPFSLNLLLQIQILFPLIVNSSQFYNYHSLGKCCGTKPISRLLPSLHLLVGTTNGDLPLQYGGFFCLLLANEQLKLRARPLTLHLHFYIRNANADAGKCPTQPGITQSRLKKFPEGAKLPAFPRFMQGACYQLKIDNFEIFLEIIGCGLTR